MPWVGLAVTLVWNYTLHRRHRARCTRPGFCWRHATICAITRLLPPWALIVGWSVLTSWLIPHLLRGYPPRTKETL